MQTSHPIVGFEKLLADTESQQALGLKGLQYFLSFHRLFVWLSESFLKRGTRGRAIGAGMSIFQG